MYVASNMLSHDEFKSLNTLFECNGWNIKNNSLEHITYTKFGNETEFFEIKLDNNSIYVSTPLKNSSFQYKTKFDNYLSAIKYTELKFNYFNENENDSF